MRPRAPGRDAARRRGGRGIRARTCEAGRRHGLHTLLGLGWGLGVYWLAPSYTWWLLPVVGALALSIPISVYSSRVSLGRALRRARLFVVPEEADPPRELRTVRTHAERASEAPGFVDAVVDPAMNAIVCAAVPRHGRAPDRARALRARVIATAMERGPDALSDRQKRLVLTDPVVLSQLHLQVATSAAAHPAWRARPAPAVSEHVALAAAS